jgi:hypothetical protein
MAGKQKQRKTHGLKTSARRQARAPSRMKKRTEEERLKAED